MSIYTWVTGRNQLSQVKGTLSLPCFFPSANISVLYQHWSIPSPYFSIDSHLSVQVLFGDCIIHQWSVWTKIYITCFVKHCGLSCTLDVNNCQMMIIRQVYSHVLEFTCLSSPLYKTTSLHCVRQKEVFFPIFPYSLSLHILVHYFVSYHLVWDDLALPLPNCKSLFSHIPYPHGEWHFTLPI